MMANLNMQDEIGQSAGQIYNYLAGQTVPVTMTKMKKDLDMKSNFADLGLGWLAREDKVNIEKVGNSVKVNLK